MLWLLGEMGDTCGKRHDIQLKGSGRTPFSRNGDGKAPLGPVLREYLIGEAMNALVYQRRGPLQLLPQEIKFFGRLPRSRTPRGSQPATCALAHFNSLLHAERRKLSVSSRITLLHATTQRRAMQINPT